MSLARTISAMVAAGCTPQQLEAVVCAHEASEQARIAERRAKDAERQRRHRESRVVTVTGRDERDEAEILPPPVSPPFTSPTPPSHNPPLSPTNTEAGADANALGGEILAPSQSPSAPEAKSRASPDKRGMRLPRDWKPSDEEFEIARTEGIPDEHIPRIAAEFRDYWSDVPGKGGLKLSWTGTWRNNCRRAADRFRGSRSASSAGHGSQGGGRLAAYQRAASRFPQADDVPGERPDIFDHGGRVLAVR